MCNDVSVKLDPGSTQAILSVLGTLAVLVCLVSLPVLVPVGCAGSTGIASKAGETGEASEGDRVVVANFTEENLLARMYWRGFMKGCMEGDPNIDTGGYLDTVRLDLELNFDKRTLRGRLQGRSQEHQYSKQEYSVEGTINGWVRRANRDPFWYWEFGGIAHLTLSFHKEKDCYDPEEKKRWTIKKTDTINIAANLSGSGWAGRGGIGALIIHWEDKGGLRQKKREFYLYCAHRQDSGGCLLPVKLPDPIDLNISIKGPSIVGPDPRPVSFPIEVKGKDKDMIKNASWYFYYLDPEWERTYDNPRTWWYLATINQEPLSDVEVPTSTVSQFLDQALEMGTKIGEYRELDMKVALEIYDTENRYISTQNAFFPMATQQYKVRAEIKDIETNISDSYDIYPTQPNITTLEIYYLGKNPISLTHDADLPYLEISFDPPIVQHKTDDTDDPLYAKLNITLNYAKAQGLSLPTTRTVEITAKGMDTEYKKQITLNLLPAQWLLMLYIDGDTMPDLSDPFLMYYGEIGYAASENGTPKIGITALVDLTQVNNAVMVQMRKPLVRPIGARWGPTNMSSAQTLQRFIKESMDLFPAKHNHLIIYGHGAGIAGVISDYNQGGGKHSMQYEDMKRAIQKAVGTHKIDIITFNSCLQSQIEVLHHLRNIPEYFIASELIMYCSSMHYDKFINKVFQNPHSTPRQQAELLVSTYTKSTAPFLNCTLHATQASKLENIAETVDALGKALVKGYQPHDMAYNTTLARIINATSKSNIGYPYTDIKDLAQRISTHPGIKDQTIKTAAQNVVSAINSAVVAGYTNTYVEDMKKLELVKSATPGYYGLTILLWNYGTGGDLGKLYNYFLGHYQKTEFSKQTGWKEFLDQYVVSVPRKTIQIKLKYPDHELSLHAYDQKGRHIGLNRSLLNDKITPIDCQIPGAAYYDLQNGTKIILLPGEITNFTTVIDGQDMEEDQEPYTLQVSLTQNGQTTHTKNIEATIQQNTTQTTPITITTHKIEIGQTTTKQTQSEDTEKEDHGDEGTPQLPEWFTENLPFLQPILEPILPHIPTPILPYLPYIIIGTPILLIILIGVSLKNRKDKQGKSEQSEQPNLDI